MNTLPDTWPFPTDQREAQEPTEVTPYVINGRIVGYSLKPRRPPLTDIPDAPY